MSFPKRSPLPETSGYAAPITPSNTTTFDDIAQRLWVGNPGVVYIDAAGNGEGVLAAQGEIDLTGSSGTVGATIGGTLVTVAWATSDSVTATALAVAINADAAANLLVSAAATGAIVLLTATSTGLFGNAITLVASGTSVTVSGATLGTGSVSASTIVDFDGSSGVVGATINGLTITVTWATSDTATAAAWTTAVNLATSTLYPYVTALASGETSVVSVRVAGSAGNAMTTVAVGTSMTVTGSTMAGGVDARAGTGGVGSYLPYNVQSSDYIQTACTKVYAYGTTASNINREW